MNKKLAGLLFGALAGVLDVVPMIIQKLPWSANLSALAMWVVVGFLISTSNLKLAAPVKGLLVAFLVLSPCAVIIGWQEPKSLVPIGIMTVVLGSALGFCVEKFGKSRDRS